MGTASPGISLETGISVICLYFSSCVFALFIFLFPQFFFLQILLSVYNEMGCPSSRSLSTVRQISVRAGIAASCRAYLAIGILRGAIRGLSRFAVSASADISVHRNKVSHTTEKARPDSPVRLFRFTYENPKQVITTPRFCPPAPDTFRLPAGYHRSHKIFQTAEASHLSADNAEDGYPG